MEQAKAMTPFDPSKPARTKSGLPARFLGKLYNPKTAYPLIFVVGEPSNEEVSRYDLNGKFFQSLEDDNFDLENIPVKHTREVWINIYHLKDDTFRFFNSKAHADGCACAGTPRIACKKITLEFEEGEGLMPTKEKEMVVM